MRVKIRSLPKAGLCLVCQRNIGLLRGLASRRFCSNEHEQEYLAQLKDIGITRLLDSGVRPGKSHV